MELVGDWLTELWRSAIFVRWTEHQLKSFEPNCPNSFASQSNKASKVPSGYGYEKESERTHCTPSISSCQYRARSQDLLLDFLHEIPSLARCQNPGVAEAVIVHYASRCTLVHWNTTQKSLNIIEVGDILYCATMDYPTDRLFAWSMNNDEDMASCTAKIATVLEVELKY